MNYFLIFKSSLLTAALTLTLNATATDTPDAPKRMKKGKWEKIFDGKTLTGWHNYLKSGQPVSDKWQVEDGAIHLNGRGAGDILTDKDYGNFELELEWKIAEKGNSGIMYHVVEDPKYKTTYMTGPEVQVLDNERHPDAKQGRNGNRTAGSLYDMLPPSDASAYKPAGEWNKVRIVVNNGKAEHYLNGKKIVEYPTSGPEWDKMVENSKFKGWEAFGKAQSGKIALQDHGDQVWYRNIRIREL
ncbi:protein of unknown function DUF1080 [Fibrisoma limi BUZ 3]|uniref:3-keto-alpha-glucoside-1,2-lyase/3-keto-2-hydroxy-glucal hydratase domain-containing protein n=1 Tax=Fibrisoma limi BUZ 3 TaxID=1185876 RepID=I2GPX8_9BACT|nr:DUF1080 domain-containing protein [Fibrisoma limi]CCH55956.1 protein of unknown function DUF1080 [Fibrisoma limi BUZ 3]